LDRTGARAVAGLLSDLDDGAVTILATTHDPALIAAASDRLDLQALRAAASAHDLAAGASDTAATAG
jgi:ABC-type lipoprotein export system ATPase subunit